MASNPTIWLTPKEAAAYTKLSVITLRRAVQAKRLLAFRYGRAVRYRVTDLDRVMRSANCDG